MIIRIKLGLPVIGQEEKNICKFSVTSVKRLYALANSTKMSKFSM